MPRKLASWLCIVGFWTVGFGSFWYFLIRDLPLMDPTDPSVVRLQTFAEQRGLKWRIERTEDMSTYCAALWNGNSIYVDVDCGRTVRWTVSGAINEHNRVKTPRQVIGHKEP